MCTFELGDVFWNRLPALMEMPEIPCSNYIGDKNLTPPSGAYTPADCSSVT